MDVNKENIFEYIGSFVENEKTLVTRINSVAKTHGEVPQNLMNEMNIKRSDALRGFETYVRAHGWPVMSDNNQFTVNTWLLAQHAIGIPEVAELFLAEMKKALDSGGLPGWQYAFFYDHYAHRMGRPQRYGTVLQANRAGVITPHTLEDPGQVDALRKEMGLPKLEEALRQANQQFAEGSSTKKAPA